MKSTQPQDDRASAELQKARDLAATDGNAFHAKVATHFRQREWRVLISPYYVDNATGQAREVDLLCERLFPTAAHLLKERITFQSLQLRWPLHRPGGRPVPVDAHMF
jgi:hypothetical protein